MAKALTPRVDELTTRVQALETLISSLVEENEALKKRVEALEAQASETPEPAEKPAPSSPAPRRQSDWQRKLGLALKKDAAPLQAKAQAHGLILQTVMLPNGDVRLTVTKEGADYVPQRPYWSIAQIEALLESFDNPPF